MSNNAQTRANQTRTARRQFVQDFGENTVDVVRAIVNGWDSTEIADDYGMPVGTVAAYRANLTRGAYAPYVQGSVNTGFTGTCNFG